MIHSAAHVERLEHLLLGQGRDRRQARRDEVGQFPRIRDVRCEGLEIVGEQRRQRDHVLEIALDVALQRIDLQMILIARRLHRGAHLRAKIRTGRDHAIETHSGKPLDDQA